MLSAKCQVSGIKNQIVVRAVAVAGVVVVVQVVALIAVVATAVVVVVVIRILFVFNIYLRTQSLNHLPITESAYAISLIF